MTASASSSNPSSNQSPNPTSNQSSVQLSIPSTNVAIHPWTNGYIFESPGAHLTYRVVGPCCRLYDREQLPWPCCRIQWRSKEPSWRRIGRRFIVDLSTRKHPSYCVEIIGQSYRSEPIIMTLYTFKFSSEQQDWWHTKRVQAT
ncbi:MAG: hypothetical protein AAFQ63_20010 [Cyanobacteria bacterium J06621_11]